MSECLIVALTEPLPQWNAMRAKRPPAGDQGPPPTAGWRTSVSVACDEVPRATLAVRAHYVLGPLELLRGISRKALKVVRPLPAQLHFPMGRSYVSVG